MQKAYTRINNGSGWKNTPSTETPINEDNLNHMDSAIDTIDTRVVELDGYSSRAKASEDNAKVSETNAGTSASNASASASSASASATSSSASATLSESYAKGGTSSRQSEDVDNAKYYKEVAESKALECNSLVQALGNIYIYQTSVTWAEFNAIDTTKIKAGYTWNLTESFTSDSRFIDGGGIEYGKGTNVTWGDKGKWDCNDGISAGTGIIKISYAEFKAHESDYRATGKTYWVYDADEDVVDGLKSVFFYSKEDGTTATQTPRDADLLGGNAPNYYATASQITSINESLGKILETDLGKIKLKSHEGTLGEVNVDTRIENFIPASKFACVVGSYIYNSNNGTYYSNQPTSTVMMNNRALRYKTTSSEFSGNSIKIIVAYIEN